MRLKQIKLILSLIIVLLAIIWSVAYVYIAKNKTTTESLVTHINSLSAENQTLAERLINLETQLSKLAGNLEDVTASPAPSQDELITGAVGRASPAVVSVLVHRNEPQYWLLLDTSTGIIRREQIGTVRRQIGAGTGFVINSRGIIVTNRHVASDPNALYTIQRDDGQILDAQLRHQDSRHDIAILSTQAGLPFIPLGDSSGLRPGQTVIAIGNALGRFSNSVSVGIVSGLNRSIQASDGRRVEQLSDVIQTDAAINPGNSGGPLINTQGQAVGVNVATVIGSSNISFSIPINVVKDILAQGDF